ncbi:hypothetical protein [Streptomyces syringium]|uniref:hypothetical protein n=1 Tax=Streptomyces syringium TaxID=76729 RepID=UPI003AAC2CA0
MRTQHDHAARALKITCNSGGEEGGDGTEFWGWAGRTLGKPGTTPDGHRVWLRLVSAPADKASGKTWEGAETAQQALGNLHGHRPALLAVHDTTEQGTFYRAELSEHLDHQVISTDPVLRCPVDLPVSWWAALPRALDTLAGTPTDRIAVRREYIDRALPEFLGVPAPRTIDWTTAHGDLHWANLTSPELRILDWEGWGRAPYGYDQATLYAYSLRQPATAAHVRTAFRCLDNPHTWTGQAVIAAELLQTLTRGDNHDLAESLHQWADQLRAMPR